MSQAAQNTAEPDWRRLYKSDQEKFEDCFRMTIGGREMELEQVASQGAPLC